MKPLRLVVVSYLNSKPFIEGLHSEFGPDELEIVEQIPSACAESFKTGKADLGLIPVGALLDFDSVEVLNHYCIGADGKVDSVFLFAQQPIETLDAVYLDWHSRSSNGLARVLLRHHWKQEPALLSEPDYFDRIAGATGGIVIGDRAIAIRHQYKYVYDLAAEWKAWSGLPFAFAVWAYHPERVGSETVSRIYQAFERGMANRTLIAQKWAPHFGMTAAAAEDYLRHAIDYDFNAGKQKAVHLYLSRLAELNLRPQPELRIAAALS